MWPLNFSSRWFTAADRISPSRQTDCVVVVRGPGETANVGGLCWNQTDAVVHNIVNPPNAPESFSLK